MQTALFCLESPRWSTSLLSGFSAQAGLFGPKGDSAEEKRQNVLKQREEMLAELYKTKPELKGCLPKAAGYATFKMTDMNLFLLASGNGYGALRDNKTGKDTFMRVASLGGGVGMGIKDLRVIFVFNDAKVMQQFVEQGWQFGGKGDASAKAVSPARAAQILQVEHQMALFIDLNIAAEMPALKFATKR
jgi:lipid-binding SYLF domain-containing protein